MCWIDLSNNVHAKFWRITASLQRLLMCFNSCRVVFDTLYLLLSFGHETPEEADKLDPPFSYFRIRLVCSLLETCGQFFNKGLAKKRLDRFLTFFQRYLLAKPPLPLDVEFDVQVCSFPPWQGVHNQCIASLLVPQKVAKFPQHQCPILMCRSAQ